MRAAQALILALAGGCALLAIIGAMLFAGVGQEITPAAALQRPDPAVAAGLDGHEFALPPLEEYAQVTERPLFNEDRRPAPPDTAVDPDDESQLTDQPAVELNVTVTGIIITPEKKLAMVVDNTTQQQFRLAEGMPLEGEQSAWTLTSIEARKVVFDGGMGDPQEVELETYTQALKGGSPGRQRARPAVTQEKQDQAAADAAPGQAVKDDDRAARAEEIRRRVAERRAQLREEAARRREEQEQENDNE